MAVRRVIEPGNEIDQCRLAAAGGADDRQCLAALNPEADMGELIFCCAGVAEADVPEFDAALLRPLGPCALGNGGAPVQDLIDSFCRDLRLGQQHKDHDQHHKGHDDVCGIGAEDQYIAEHRQPRSRVADGELVDQGRA